MSLFYPLFQKEIKDLSQPLRVISSFTPSGDQPRAIETLVKGIQEGERDQVLLGVTGSGKTFTMAHVVAQVQKPTLIMAPNKILAAQLYGEMKEFFPNNAVEYFVSYYDYYRPEAYVPRTDTFIEKESSINEQIDRMRHSATRALLERRDVILVASVSCLYGIGGVETYSQMTLPLEENQEISPADLIRRLVSLHYKRNDMAFSRGNFRVRGDTVDVFPAHYEDRAWRIGFFGDVIETLEEIDALTHKRIEKLSHIRIFANSHYVTPGPTLTQAISCIRQDLSVRLEEFTAQGKLLEAQRLEQRVKFDLEMMAATGMCSGIENYSRYLTGRSPGSAPPTLFEYIPKDALLIIDESHATLPQIRAMYKGDASRKTTLSDHGFRLPSCRDNRPLTFEEWENLRPQTVYVSATPGPWELEKTEGLVVEQVIRPTGLVDPVCLVRPCEAQVDDLIAECQEAVRRHHRVLVTTLTKKMAESLTEYLQEVGLKVQYMHADVETLERIALIRDLRKGLFDILVGINLLREGLDIPECGLVAILDADKEGYLRSRTSLIQTIGRAARHAEGRVILYADRWTQSMTEALAETQRRRERQQAHNAQHQIIPQTVSKGIPDLLQGAYETACSSMESFSEKSNRSLKGAMSQSSPLSKDPKNLKSGKAILAQLEKKMKQAASELHFEEAARYRDEIRRLETSLLLLQS